MTLNPHFSCKLLSQVILVHNSSIFIYLQGCTIGCLHNKLGEERERDRDKRGTLCARREKERSREYIAKNGYGK